MLLRLLPALVLNAVLVWGVVRWLPRVRQLPTVGKWVVPTLGLKLIATGISIAVLSEDAAYFQVWSGRLTDQLWHAPGAWLRMLPTDEFHWGGWHLVFHGFSNTLFLVKLLSVVNLASLGNALLNGCYLSVFCFVCSWELVRQMWLQWPHAVPSSALTGFLLWPTVVYWTSGLTKESLLVGSGALVLALVIRLAYADAGRRGWLVVGLAAAVVLHFKMRYFFAVILFGCLTGLGLVRVVQQLGGARSRVVQALLIVALLAGGAWAASEVSPVFRANKFTSQLQRNYSDLLKTSQGRPHLEYPTLKPTTESVVLNSPQAVFNTLARPWPWEGGSVLYVLAGLENLGLLLLLGVAVWSVLRGQLGHMPFALVFALLLYCLILAALLGLTTPNLGTLNRYRVTFLPFLLVLVLQAPYPAAILRRFNL
ncbi:hypothetical protein K3G63_05750 [Hymenobacter sp. HSC-4F20]|uniref:hypothetical protein n=1 Tax=Hymenobacter sp. HSC-4F20 TaxID=2864135 RepID=UPI001C73141D|nr:hypothetical protein [Hymenobacter sp. HSC-4F20]MBX0289933.1 hypothetical protein [Hymenobacter sp. HSC-4F20]